MTNYDVDQILEQYGQDPLSNGYELRDYLSEIIVKKCEELGWSQKTLANKAKMKESFISRLIHSQSNCTFDVAGRVLHTLGLKPVLHTAPLTELTQTNPATKPETEEFVYEQPREAGTDRGAFWGAIRGGNEKEKNSRYRSANRSAYKTYVGRQHAAVTV